MDKTLDIATVTPTQPATLTEPVVPAERLGAVDVLRGVAVLGILLINIEEFGLPNNGHRDLLTGRIGNPDVVVWAVNAVLFEGKMRAIFSMLFGAGVILLTSRLERRDATSLSADIYYRRTLWLLVFGLAHAYFLWEGDILYAYAISGLFLFPFRKLGAGALITLGLIQLALTIPGAMIMAHHFEELRDQVAQADADEAAGKHLTKKQRDARMEWKTSMERWQPDGEAIQESIDAHRGSYGQLFSRRAALVGKFESKGYYYWGFFDTTGMMLIGMGLMKLGVVGASRSAQFYTAMVLLGFGLGLPLHAYAAYQEYVHQFDPVHTAWIATAYNPGRLAIALGHIGLVMLVVRAGIAQGLTSKLAAVGRMALTCYLTTTVICTVLFDGYGFGLFGSLRRYQLYFVVLAVWTVLLFLSSIWLRFFLFGPAEWTWRSLTYWRPQALRRREAACDQP